MKKTNLEKIFGEYVLDDVKLKRYMNHKNYMAFKKIKDSGEELDKETASFVAKAIKKWALKNGASHYSHWFMPLTNKTAEMQVSFIEISSSGKVIEDFTYKQLIKGEADASSFPNGGERMTFEARGYTVWDYTSPVFINEDDAGNKTVYIPTAFCSYNGTALDEKTPLLRAGEKFSHEATRLLNMLGYSDVKKVNLFAGAEQEYFLIKTEDYEKRLDLKMTGRTLVGAKPLMSQEECSHYFGMIEDDISAFMNEVDRKLWKMGIMAKHQHNEVAPMQFEFVPIFSLANIASDQNQIIMQVINKTSKKFGMTALFHEKPFASINGSGKHANWSLSTNTGINLLDASLKDKKLFYTFFIAMIEAIDKYYKLIRLSCAYRSNDLRLGGSEAPPALISVFTGDYILKDLEKLEEKSSKLKKSVLDTGVKGLFKLEKDFCDRNRTSPFAFGGNKFEFRMVGSSQSISFPCTCMLTALSSVIKNMADEIENSSDKNAKLFEILKNSFEKHQKIIFNGNGYSSLWKEEATIRGLVEYKDLLSVYKILEDKDIVSLFEETGVLSENEISLRENTILKKYENEVLLEAKTLVEILNKNILPSICEVLSSNKIVSFSKNKIENNFKEIEKNLLILSESIVDVDKKENLEIIVKNILETMEKIRKSYDEIEPLFPEEFEPFPTYNDILFKA